MGAAEPEEVPFAGLSPAPVRFVCCAAQARLPTGAGPAGVQTGVGLLAGTGAKRAAGDSANEGARCCGFAGRFLSSSASGHRP